MNTTIYSNGSKWAGESPDSVETLLDVLSKYTLRPDFDGIMIDRNPRNMAGDALLPEGGVSFFGNFYELSHVFQIDSTDSDIIARLTAAIEANIATPAYAAAKAEYAETIRQRTEREATRERQRREQSEQRARRVLRLT